MQILQSLTIFAGIVVHPFIGECAAFLGTNGIYPATIFRIEHGARAIRAILEYESRAIRRDLGLIGDKIRFAHMKVRGDFRGVVAFQPHDPFDLAACSATTTLEILIHQILPQLRREKSFAQSG